MRELRGDKPWTRTVWRDAETEPQRARKAPPRRGSDPKQERQEREATGEVKRRRDTPIADPKAIGTPGGMPIGVQLIAAPWKEAALFRVAGALAASGLCASPEPPR